MNGRLLKVYFFAFCLLSILIGPAAFADEVGGDDTRDALNQFNTDEQAREENTQKALAQIHDLEVRMQNTGKQLDALEKALHNTEKAPEAPDADQEPAAQEESQPAAASDEQTSVQEETSVFSVPSARLTGPLNYYVPSSEIISKVHQFQMATEFSYIQYKEPGVMREKGPFFGVYGSYDYRPEALHAAPINVFHADIHGDFGLVDYKSTFEANHIQDYMVEPRMWLGKDFDLGSSVQLTPYVGAGYRYLFDKFSKAEFGYDRRSQYFYLPDGIKQSINQFRCAARHEGLMPLIQTPA